MSQGQAEQHSSLAQCCQLYLYLPGCLRLYCISYLSTSHYCAPPEHLLWYLTLPWISACHNNMDGSRIEAQSWIFIKQFTGFYLVTFRSGVQNNCVKACREKCLRKIILSCYKDNGVMFFHKVMIVSTLSAVTLVIEDRVWRKGQRSSSRLMES